MDKRRYITLAAAVAMMCGGAALAQQAGHSSQEDRPYQSFRSSEHGQRADEELRGLDRNRDQRIDQSEAQSDPELIAAWAEVDLSRDGSLDATEYYLFAAQRELSVVESDEARSPQADARSQRQGSVQSPNTGDQRTAGQLLTAAGQLSQAAEILEGVAEQQLAMANEQQGETGSRSDQPANPLERNGSDASGIASFEDADQDSDGQLSRTEVAVLEGIDFSSRDRNQDGSLSRDEYQQVAQE